MASIQVKSLLLEKLPDDVEDLYGQMNLIDNWKPVYDVWPLKYGHVILGALGAGAGMYVNYIFRRKLKIFDSGTYFTYGAVGLGAGVGSSIFHKTIVTKQILMYEGLCSTCLETQASLMQTGSAILYPILLSPAINFGIAYGQGIFVPPIYDMKNLSLFWWSIVKPALRNITILFTVNTLAAGILTFGAMQSMDYVQSVVLERYQLLGKDPVDMEGNKSI